MGELNQSFEVTYDVSEIVRPLSWTDLVQLLNEPQPEQIPLRFSFRASVQSTNPDGESRLEVLQVCRGELDHDQDTVAIGCEKEIVDINSEQ